MHPGFPPEMVAEVKTQARSKVADFMDSVLLGGLQFSGWRGILFGVLILPISIAYLLIGRFFMGKLFFASDRCTSCALCAEHCPNRAIEMRGREGHQRPYWTFHCESCVRCMAFCPTRAIEASHLLGVGAYLAAGAIPAATLLVWLAARVPLLSFLGGAPRWLLQALLSIIVIGVAYPLFHLALRIGWINRFFTVAALTNYYRRYHEPETGLRDLSRRATSE